MHFSTVISAAALAAAAWAQQPAWGQCGGIGWTGGTTCVSGYVCQVGNPYYSQCVPGTGQPATTTRATTTAVRTTTPGASNPTPTLYLCGDSTMARASGATDGWGNHIAKYLTGVTVANHAIGGRSARSFTREGRFQTVINAVKAGDFVIIEFGHNDGGGLSTDNGRSDCPGTGPEVCQVTYNGVPETILTFSAYLENAARAMKAKGANVIIASQTPRNPWAGTTTWPGTANPIRFVPYAQTSAQRESVTYVNHWLFAMDLYRRLGASTTNALYPTSGDVVHTSPTGADHMARAFIKGLQCSSGALKSKINASAASVVTGSCV